MSRAIPNGRILIDFRDGKLVSILPIADSDQEAESLIQQLEEAAICGDLTGIKGGHDEF